MTERENIRKAIEENIIQRDLKPNSNIDHLDFLVEERERRIEHFELGQPLTLKNSWWKANRYLFLAGFCIFFIYMMMSNGPFASKPTYFVVLGIMVLSTIMFLTDFFERKVVLKLDSQGLTVDADVFNQWKEIEYLYYKKVYDSEGKFQGDFLVEKLKNGSELEVQIDKLPLTKKELGLLLYHYMKQYGS